MDITITPWLQKGMEVYPQLEKLVTMLLDSGIFLPGTSFDCCGNKGLRFWFQNVSKQNTLCVCIIPDDANFVKVRPIVSDGYPGKWLQFRLEDTGSSEIPLLIPYLERQKSI
jgi:hypothetical protein